MALQPIRQTFGFSPRHAELAALGHAAAPTPVVFERAAPQRWEYRVITIDPREDEPLSEARLGELGAEGWLLAGTAQYPVSSSAVRIAYYFVRAA